ncbi:MAG: hypothetical protein ACRD2N_10920 [Vicinamibacterales bacterium]
MAGVLVVTGGAIVSVMRPVHRVSGRRRLVGRGIQVMGVFGM